MKMARRISVIIMMCVISYLTGSGQSHPLFLHHLSRADGLLHDNTTCVTVDPYGFIWIGTHRGINRYDGYRLAGWNYPGNDANPDRVYGMALSGSKLLLATEAGLIGFDPQRLEYMAPLKGADSHEDEIIAGISRINAVAGFESEGWCWAVVNGEGAMLRLADDGTVEFLPVGNDKTVRTNVEVPSAAFNGEDILWVSGRDMLEIYRLEGKGKARRFTLVDRSSLVEATRVHALCYESPGRLWIGMPDEVVCAVVDKAGRPHITGQAKLPTSAELMGLALTADNVWAVANDGLFRISKTTCECSEAYRRGSNADGEVLSDANSIYTDRFGNLWMTGWMSGAAFSNPMALGFSYIQPGGEDKFVSALCYDSVEHNIYAATKFHGISRIGLPDMEVTDINSSDMLANVVSSLSVSGDNLYASVADRIIALDKHSGSISGIVSTRRQGYVFWTAFDRFGRMWVATSRGLECFSSDADGNWAPDSRVNDKEGLPDPRLTAIMGHNILSDTVANELIITSAKGVHRLMLDADGGVGRIVRYTAGKPGGLSSDYTWSIVPALDYEGHRSVWVGTMGKGLNRLVFIDRADGTYGYRVRRSGTDCGAASDDVESIVVDGLDRVWCAGAGLHCYDTYKGLYNNYGVADGLLSATFCTSCAVADSTGTMWFGGADGICHFKPEGQMGAPVRTDVLISDIMPDNNRVQFPQSGRVSLKYPDNGLNIALTTLSYGAERHLRYRYRLLGYDDRWREILPGSDPEIRYSRLPYGSFVFEAEAGDSNGWSGQITSLVIDSEAPWWLSGWAMALYIVLAIALAVVLARYLMKWSAIKREMALRRQTEVQQQAVIDMKERFFTDVSHEFRTPLTLIRHAADNLSTRLGGDDRHVHMISRNAAVLTSMVNELLDFHRAGHHKFRLQASPVNLDALIRPIIDEFSLWASEVGLTMNFSITPEAESTEIWADAEIVTKMLTNILSNSIRYTDAGGTVDIDISIGSYGAVKPQCAEVYSLISAMETGPQAIIRVRDNGIGISAKALPTIFDRLTMDDDSPQRPSVGSGIGLALVRALAEVHHAGIMVSSEKGYGSEFIIFIPVSDGYLLPGEKADDRAFVVNDYLKDVAAGLELPADDAGEEPAAADVATDAPTILVVDDHREIRSALRELFANMRVITAHDGREALDRIAAEMPDIIVSDMMMPRIDGAELCRTLKSDLHTCHIPLVLLTAMAHEENHIAGIELGADAYVTKPYNPRLLTAVVTNLLQRQARERTEAGPTRSDLIREGKDELFERFRQLVRENFANEGFTVDDIWRSLGMNRTKLYAFVKEKTGISLGVYVRRMRLEEAARLLLTTDMPVAEVAFAVGISSPAYFARAFKEQYSVSPTEYIRQHQSRQS